MLHFFNFSVLDADDVDRLVYGNFFCLRVSSREHENCASRFRMCDPWNVENVVESVDKQTNE